MKAPASTRSPEANSTPIARPFRVRIDRGWTPLRISPPCSRMSSTSASANLIDPPRHIWALWRPARIAAIEWPNPRACKSISRMPLKNNSPARITSCSNSSWTNPRGVRAETSRNRRPRAERCNSSLRRSGGKGGDCTSGRMICSTIGRNSSTQRLRVAASLRENSANESTVLSKSVHHSKDRPSGKIKATLSSGST